MRTNRGVTTGFNPEGRPVRQQPSDSGRYDVQEKLQRSFGALSAPPVIMADAELMKKEIEEFLELGIGVTSWSVGS